MQFQPRPISPIAPGIPVVPFVHPRPIEPIMPVPIPIGPVRPQDYNNERKKPGMIQYIYWYTVDYDTWKKRQYNDVFKKGHKEEPFIEPIFPKEVKPVILFYSDKNESEDVEVKLQLNDNVLDIGATYPHPSCVDESKVMKEYIWKCKVNHKDNKSEVMIDNKKYSYVFWEGKGKNTDTLTGEKVMLNPMNIEHDLDELLNKLGMNSRERNDFIVYWIRTLESMKTIEVTICDDSYNRSAPLNITNYSQQLRIFLLFHTTDKPYNEDEGVNRIATRERPRGKYIVEWGGSVSN